MNKFKNHSFNFFILSFFFIWVEFILPQSPDTLWTKTYGGTNIDVGYAVQQTSDAGFIITGYTRSFGTISGRNVWLIKTDPFGNQLWNKTFGGNNDEEGNAVQQTTDGGYIIAGYTKSLGAGLNDVYLIKTDTAGNLVWSKTFGGTQDEEAYSVQQTTDGGYIIAGATSSYGAGSRDVWLIKTDQNGNDIWKKTLGGMSSDGARFVQQTSDGGFIITGWTYSLGPGAVGNVLLIKTDSSGNQIWFKAFGGTDVDRGYCVKQLLEGGYLITGYTASTGAGLDDMLLIKTDSNGNTIWEKTYGGSGRDYGNGVIQTNDGGYVVAGYTLSYGAGSEDVWIVKTDSSGNQQWMKTLGGAQSDIGYFINYTDDGGLIVTGHTLSFGAGVHDVWLIKLNLFIPVELISFSAHKIDNKVILNWSTATEKNNKGFFIERKKADEEFIPIAFVQGNGTSLTQHIYSFTDAIQSFGKYSYRLKQVDFDGTSIYSDVIKIDVVSPGNFLLEQNYPNPFNPVTSIRYSIPAREFVTLKLYDVLSTEIKTLVSEEQDAGRYSINFDGSKLASGIYYYQLKAGNFTDVKKMCLVK